MRDRDRKVPVVPAPAVIDANRLVQSKLSGYLTELERAFRADCISYSGPIAFGADNGIRDALEAIPNKRGRLLFLLETIGGYAETARRIADSVRYHYRRVDFLVPGHALSAGTILVMAGDAIHMDYYSVLGPIDPQVESDGKLVPALGYLLRYQKLLEKGEAGRLSTAEMEILLSFDQGQLYSYEQARNLSISLLEEWLVKYKFKNWKVTKTRGVKVTHEMKVKRAREIGRKLNDVERWNSHGIGINRDRLERILKLQIDDFGRDRKLHGIVRCYHGLLTDFMGKMSLGNVVHTRQAFQATVLP